VPKILPKIATGVMAIRPPPTSVRQRRAYTPSELARELGVHRASIYRWVSAGLIKADASAPFVLIPLDEAMRFSREGPPR
jgi:hypothetical protein